MFVVYLLEALHSLAKTFANGWELLRAKNESSYASNHCKFRHTKSKKSTHC